MNTLETITKALQEELQIPDGYQLIQFAPTALELKHPYISLHLYIEIEPDHIRIREWWRKDIIFPYANPRLVETIQKTINKRITRMKAAHG